eukprot:GEZU01026933.1.p1 GENE.GEZU01026933.1~~GEZU01026933.1.p1  ORF type:complete len:104 (+),score=7.70 GEZU01026933.1:418-729(+)
MNLHETGFLDDQSSSTYGDEGDFHSSTENNATRNFKIPSPRRLVSIYLTSTAASITPWIFEKNNSGDRVLATARGTGTLRAAGMVLRDFIFSVQHLRDGGLYL